MKLGLERGERMIGEGGSLYWDRKVEEGKERSDWKGIVVMFGWDSITSIDFLTKFSVLYASFGWISLICSPPFVTPYFPDRAVSMAFLVIKELIEVLRMKPCPVVFSSLSGGSKACMYKVIQMLTGTCEVHLNLDDVRLVRTCITGFMYDSSPLDCTSDVGARFALNPVIHKAPGATKFVSWMVKWFTYGSDALFLTKFESQNNEYWKTLYSSINLGAPVLFLCSEKDDLAPCKVICNFARRLEDLGADIELLKWDGSPHLGHYENYTSEYGAAVASLLEKAACTFSSRVQKQVLPNTGIERTDDEIPELICHLRKAALGSLGLTPRGSSIKPITGADDCTTSWDSLNPQDEDKIRSSNNVPGTSTLCMSAHSVLGQVLFDACVPKNIEGWDIRFSGSLNGQPVASARRILPSKSMRCSGRSRL